MTDNTNTFRSLFQIDVAKYVEMKGQFSYSVVAVRRSPAAAG